jgi:hypothetical protein
LGAKLLLLLHVSKYCISHPDAAGHQEQSTTIQQICSGSEYKVPTFIPIHTVDVQSDTIKQTLQQVRMASSIPSICKL